jgi:hypothetical protein
MKIERITSRGQAGADRTGLDSFGLCRTLQYITALRSINPRTGNKTMAALQVFNQRSCIVIAD